MSRHIYGRPCIPSVYNGKTRIFHSIKINKKSKLKLIFVYFQRHRRSPHIWYHLLPTLLLWLGSSPSILLANGQCFGGVETYEKTSGTTVMCEASECNVRGLVTQEDTSVTRDCIAICKQSSACTTFTVGKA